MYTILKRSFLIRKTPFPQHADFMLADDPYKDRLENIRIKEILNQKSLIAAHRNQYYIHNITFKCG
jgi:hypothetical protein